MKTTLERLEPTKVKLTVEVGPERVVKAFDLAARALAKTVNVPGFRRGKVPRRVLEARIGKGPIVQQAIEDAVGRFYAEAVESESVAAVAPPEIDLQQFTEEEGCAFEATVEVRPEIELPDHAGISVPFPEWEVSEEEVQRQLAELRERFAELEEVDRPAASGDYVTIDLSVARSGKLIERASAEDALYEVGSSGVTPKLDEKLVGAAAGQTLTYVDNLPDDYPEHGGKPAEFTVRVKDVREKHLPDLDDEFAAVASEFDTLAELEEDIRRNLQRRKLMQAQQEVRGRILEAYLATVDVALPESMVQGEKDGRLQQLRDQATQYGLELEQALEMQDRTLEEVSRELEEQARNAVKSQLVLETLAEELGIGVTSVDLEQEMTRHALQHGMKPGDVARIVSERGTVGVLVGDVIRRKALEALVAAADVGDAPPRELLVELGLAAAEEQAEGNVEEGAQTAEPAAWGEEQLATAAADEGQGEPADEGQREPDPAASA